MDQKTSEHKAALEVLKTLVWEGRVLTGDTIFCQCQLCAEIFDLGADNLAATIRSFTPNSQRLFALLAIVK